MRFWLIDSGLFQKIDKKFHKIQLATIKIQHDSSFDVVFFLFSIDVTHFFVDSLVFNKLIN